MNPKQFRHTLTAWGGQPTKSRLRRGQISVDPSAPWDGQGDINQYDFPHTSRSDCRIITPPQQLLTNAPVWRPRAFSLPWQWRRRWQSGMEGVGKQGGGQPGAHIRSCPGLWVTLVLGFTEAQVRLISGRALHYLSTLLRNIFSGYQLLYFNIASWLWGALREGLQKSIRLYNFYLGGAPALYLHCT